MKIADQALQSIWYDPEADAVRIIDQTRLPHQFEILTLADLTAACHAIRSMQVRGAPLIGVTAAYGVYLALRAAPASLEEAIERLAATRPTAVNLQWALSRCREALAELPDAQRPGRALQLARAMEAEDIAVCEAIGEHGAALLGDLWQARQDRQARLNILTHCNAGALATVDWGTALAVVYKLAAQGVPVHVWVDETRPRNQGAALTCWELGQRRIPHTLIVDNAGGHLMQRGEVDVCLVGSDRTAANGDVCNKIGTYLKALAAHDNGVPFYVALPVSSIDFSRSDGRDIPIEKRAATEVTTMIGADAEGLPARVALTAPGTEAANPGFDVTPARLVSGLITEFGVVAAEPAAIRG
ncbi:MAG: S-methyl-5-thioribose-1-phosphate isomerase, partial [Pseudohongiellaceae bacterium]